MPFFAHQQFMYPKESVTYLTSPSSQGNFIHDIHILNYMSRFCCLLSLPEQQPTKPCDSLDSGLSNRS